MRRRIAPVESTASRGSHVPTDGTRQPVAERTANGIRQRVEADRDAGVRVGAVGDLRPPLLRVSADGNLGWLIAEVEIRGTRIVDGVETPVDAIWAWIELYEKQSGTWRLIGNVSNRRP